jgi:hypothetical protein
MCTGSIKVGLHTGIVYNHGFNTTVHVVIARLFNTDAVLWFADCCTIQHGCLVAQRAVSMCWAFTAAVEAFH